MRKFFESYTFAVWLLVLLLGAWTLGLKYNIFFLVRWLDMPFHFAGGFFVFVLWTAFSNSFKAQEPVRLSPISAFLISIGFVMLVGVFWEFFELYLDRYITHQGLTYLPGVYEDTLADLFFDCIGGVSGNLLYNKYHG
jgi:hypothetical protein